MSQLDMNYDWPTIYISYYFVQEDATGLYRGYVEFAEESNRGDNMTFGGVIVI